MCIHEIGKKKQTQIENHFSKAMLIFEGAFQFYRVSVKMIFLTNPMTWPMTSNSWNGVCPFASVGIKGCAYLCPIIEVEGPIEAAQLNLSMPSRGSPLGSYRLQGKLQPNHIF